jgi:DNA-binding CsgD family transcriptional regulator
VNLALTDLRPPSSPIVTCTDTGLTVPVRFAGPASTVVALLVAEGATNREAAAALFVSPKTIEFHLGKVFDKLGLRSRAELARLLASEEPRSAVRSRTQTG